MRIAAVQFAPEFGLVDYNLDRAADLLKHEDADLYVLPELSSTGYRFLGRDEALHFAEEIPDGPTTDRLAGLARRLDAHVVGSLPERAGDKVFISAVVLGPEGVVGVYRKTHLFRAEKEIFDPGDTGFPVFDLGSIRLGVLICFDWIFPEASRSLALRGADAIVVPSCLILPWCQLAMTVRAIENRVYTLVANRWGDENRAGLEPLRFTGASRIVAPDGTVLGQLGKAEDGLVVAECDPELARDKRATPENDVFADRRPSFYRKLTS